MAKSTHLHSTLLAALLWLHPALGLAAEPTPGIPSSSDPERPLAATSERTDQMEEDSIVEAHASRARTLMSQRKYEAALTDWKAAYAVHQSPDLLIEMARCEHRLDHVEAALKNYRYFLASASNAPAALRDEATRAIETLQPPSTVVAHGESPDHSSRSAPLYRRFSARGLFGASYLPGTLTELSGERSPSGGLWVGLGLRIANTYYSLFLPSVAAHVTLGYSGRYFAIGLDVGGSIGTQFLEQMLAAANVGFATRIGSLSSAQFRLLLHWTVLPSLGKILNFPTGGELSLLIPAGSRSWFELAAFGDYWLGLFGGATFGGQHYLGSTPKGQAFFTWGVGAMYSYPLPAGLIQFGYGYRF